MKNYNPMQNKTPEERRLIALKAAKSRQENREKHLKKIEDAKARQCYLKNEIEELEKQYNQLINDIKLNKSFKQLTNKTLLSENFIIKNSIKLDEFCGIYFLIKNKKVVYIGQSINIFSRIQQHKSSVEFDKIAYLLCEKEKLDVFESLYIHLIQPCENGDKNNIEKNSPLNFTTVLERLGGV